MGEWTIIEKILAYWNRNRIKIIIIVLIIIFTVAILLITNNLIKQSIDKENYSESLKDNTTSKIESVITETQIPITIAEENETIIAKFVDNCNNGNYEQAYDMLTEECRNEQFSTLDIFIQNYCNSVFTSKKTYDLELWNTIFGTYTYRVLYYDDNIIETGQFDTGNNIEDYITVCGNGDTNVINVNGYIYNQYINKKQIIQNVEIDVENRYIYRGYEEYSINIINNSNNTIRISDGINGNDICLIDQNNTEYNAFINEISSLNLEIQPGDRKAFKIRFNKIYNTYRVIDRMSFKNINLNTNDAQASTITVEIEF